MRWRRTSFSDISAGAYDASVASEPEEELVDDEPPPDGSVVAQPGGDADADAALLATPVPLAAMPVGLHVGTLVHRMLETADFAAPDLDAELGTRIAEGQGWRHVDLGDPGVAAAGLSAALRTPLGPLLGGTRLCDIERADRLDELEFELPLAGGDEPTGRLTLAAIAAVLREHLAPGDPLHGYAARLDDPALRQNVRGYLTGSIDVVLRVRGDDGAARYAIADYKTNWLAGPGEELTAWHHRPAALAAEMRHRHYGLQALLYAVALHRYLRWRLPAYDPDRHIAGVLYLFLRGMTGPDTPVVDGAPVRRVRLAPAGRADRGAQRRVRPRGDAVSAAPAPAIATAIDLHDPRRARRAPGLLRAFNDIGVLSAADVHVAVRLTALAGEQDEWVALGAAFAVRGPRLGHVLVDLATIRATAAVDADEPVDLSALPWPDPEAWVRRLAASPLVAVGEDADPDGARPLRLVGSTLYLDRYWREERSVAADLRTFSDGAPATTDIGGARRRARAPVRGRRRRLPTPASAWPPRPPCCGASRSSPAGRAPARRRPSRGSSRCSPSRRPPPATRRRSSRSPRRRARPPPASRRRSTPRPRRWTSMTPCATSCWTCTPPRCTGCSAGGRAATAASATIAATACRTTS